MDTRRHAPLGRVRVRFAPTTARSRPHAYLGRTGRPLAEIYVADHAESLRSGRFRWLLSTCLAAMVGSLAIMVVLAGTELEGGDGGWLEKIEERLREAPTTLRLRTAKTDGLNWSAAKTDRMLIPSKATATRAYIPDDVKQRRGNRDYIMPKYYVRLVARLGPVSKAQAQLVPPFEPFKLYSNAAPHEAGGAGSQPAADITIIELNGILPNEDGQDLATGDVTAIVTRMLAAESETISAGGELLAERALRAGERETPQTSDLAKTVFEAETAEDPNIRELPAVKVQRGDTLPRILARLGMPAWQARAMMAAARSTFPDSALLPGYEVQATTLLAPGRTPGSEIVRFSVSDDAGNHKLTVARNATGDYVPSLTPPSSRLVLAALSDRDQAADNSLYASIHAIVATQDVPASTILQIMRIHAYATDFRQPVRAGDAVEFFFDTKPGEDKGIDGELGDLLATSITAGGVTHKFYQFTTSDGVTDFYDAEGSTARKFLMRRPVRAEDVRLTSGFGLRRHPLLMTAKMHYGVDWACAPGTPIMAAGNGVIEEIGSKGEYGKYIRLRHANGYKTAYAHMNKFAPGLEVGDRVQQGQTIGYVGSTGLSSGPHLHFEVLVKNTYDNVFTHVDPRTIQVPNDRQLTGKDLADFRREAGRIEKLLRRPPVATRGAELAAATQ